MTGLEALTLLLVLLTTPLFAVVMLLYVYPRLDQPLRMLRNRGVPLDDETQGENNE